jgi:hypothetical protein
VIAAIALVEGISAAMAEDPKTAGVYCLLASFWSHCSHAHLLLANTQGTQNMHPQFLASPQSLKKIP